MVGNVAQSCLSEFSLADFSLGCTFDTTISSVRYKTCGLVYLKQWSLKDGTLWCKLGIANNANRRDFEQNDLSAHAVTLLLVQIHKMNQAAAIARSIHKVQDAQHIRDAVNSCST